MPRFTIKDLLLATTLIAIGAGMLAPIFLDTVPRRISSWGIWGVFLWFLIWFGGGGLIGAGLFTPFRKVRIGVAIGVLVQFMLFVILIYNATNN